MKNATIKPTGIFHPYQSKENPMKTVHFASSDWGYAVQVCENGEIIHEYRAGNHVKISDSYVRPGSKWAENPAKLAKMASRTAMEIAKEYGVAKKNVEYDADLESELREEVASALCTMVVLNDRDTFTGTAGCVVCEYKEAELEGAGASEAIEFVQSNETMGRVLSIEALVNLYDVVMAQFNDRYLPASIKDAVEKVNLSSAEHTS
jgi:hypothetical protein